MLVTTSPGLVARPDGMFSQAATSPIRLTSALSSAIARSVPNTDAAPHMSNFIWSMSRPGFSEMPPLSNVMPLPTSTSGFCFLGLPWYSIAMKRGGSSLPAVTERNEPILSASMSLRSRTVTLTSGNSFASSSACWPR